MKRSVVVIAVALSLLLLACSGSDGDSEPVATQTQPAPVPTTSLAPQLDSSTSLPGTYVEPHPGVDGVLDTDDDVDHFANGTVIPFCTPEQIAAKNYGDPLCYNSNPPTSGPHAQSPMPFQVLTAPAPKENLVHNMEHGGVVVWYNTTDAAAIATLTQAVNDMLLSGQLVVMSRYVEMEPDTIALTSWTRLDKFATGELSRQRVLEFVVNHQRRFNPEGF